MRMTVKGKEAHRETNLTRHGLKQVNYQHLDYAMIPDILYLMSDT